MAGNGVQHGGTEELVRRLSEYSKAECFRQNSSDVHSGITRLEAGFYASEGYRAVQAMERSGFEMPTIGQQADVQWYGPSKRVYVSDSVHGLPFLSSSEMMEARPKGHSYISRKNTQDIDRFIVQEGTILISRSGTIGNVALVTKCTSGWGVSEHAIRVVVHDPIDLGPLYCFLLSAPGQFMVKRNKSGSVVDSIYEADIANLSVPRLPRALRQHLTDLVRQAADLRVEANRLLDQAEEMVYKQNYIEFDERDLGTRVAWTKSSGNCFRRSTTCSGVRFDVTRFHPALDRLEAQVLSRGSRPLGEIAQEIFTPPVFKRVYVEPDEGVPVYGGKSLLQLHPEPSGHLSRSVADLVRRPERGDVLVLFHLELCG